MTKKPSSTLEEFAALERDLRLFLAQEEHERLLAEADLSTPENLAADVEDGGTLVPFSPRSVAARSDDARTRFLAAASTSQDAATNRKERGVRRSENIKIDDADCWFEYSEKPFAVYLRGKAPLGAFAFEAGGTRWEMDPVPGSSDRHIVKGLALWQIDLFDGTGTWVK